SSGVPVHNDCLTAFQQLKLGKKIKYIVYTLNATNTEIVVEKSSSSSNYEEFIADLPENECRWAVYDFEFEKEGAKRNKICFFSWSPDTAKIKPKMVFASSRDGLRKQLQGVQLEIQGTDPSEIEFETGL
ncbi:putative COF1-cofilin, partial [Melanogaster broomeanus]